MVEEKDRKEVDQGRNIRTVRHWRKLSQNELADLLGDKIQCQVSQLERKKKIDKNILEEVAQALKVEVELLETFDPETVMEGPYYDMNNSHSHNKGSNTGAVIADNYEYKDNSLPFSEMKKMFEVIRKQDKIIADMRVMLAKNGIDYDPDQL